MKKIAPVRIMFVISGLNRGGAEVHLLNLVNHLDQTKFQPIVCVLHKGELIPEINPSIRIFHGLSKWAGDLKELPMLVRLIHRQKPAIIDFVGRDDAAFFGRLAALMNRVPVIIHSEHQGQFSTSKISKRQIYHLLNRLLDSFTGAFVAVSESQRKFMVEIGLPEKKISLIYNGVDIKKFSFSYHAQTKARQKIKMPLDVPVIGMVANFTPVKRHDVLIRALVNIYEKHPSVRCLLIGDGNLETIVKEAVKNAGLAHLVHFLGSRNDVSDLLPALDVFVLTSDSESFSYATLEAMATGKPVVVTNCGGPSELVIEGETGFLVPPGQPLALAEKVNYLLSNLEIAKNMGMAGRCRAEERFSLERMVKHREELFLRLIVDKQI